MSANEFRNCNTRFLQISFTLVAHVYSAVIHDISEQHLNAAQAHRRNLRPHIRCPVSGGGGGLISG